MTREKLERVKYLINFNFVRLFAKINLFVIEIDAKSYSIIIVFIIHHLIYLFSLLHNRLN